MIYLTLEYAKGTNGFKVMIVSYNVINTHIIELQNWIIKMYISIPEFGTVNINITLQNMMSWSILVMIISVKCTRAEPTSSQVQHQV